jgi:hypothetical protein
MRYKKPEGTGTLSLYVPETGESLSVGDNDVLEGERFEQFVAHGLLVRVPAPAAPAKVAVPEKAEAPVAQAESTSDEDGEAKKSERKRRS